MTPPMPRGGIRTYMITGGSNESEWLDRIARALSAGVDWIQLRVREADAPARELEHLVTRVLRVFDSARARFLVNDRLDLALALGAGGVHLKASSIATAEARALVPSGFLVGRSVHAAAEAIEASREGADFLVYGPVFPTSSKPGHPGTGLDALAEVARSVPIDVLALGGMTPARVADVVRVGAAGVAGISLFETAASLSALKQALEPESRRREEASRDGEVP